MLVLISLISIIYISSVHNRSDVQSVNTLSTTTYDNATADSVNKSTGSKEMKGIWISYMELSMENESEKSERRFTEKIEQITKKCSQLGFNTLIVQVRPFCDALYNSEYFPWSHILTGTQGENPGYDPLKIICEICRKNNLAVHAWINPYRIKASETPDELCRSNIYNNDNSLCFETDNGIYLNPADAGARELIVNGAAEIVRNYDIDGIQFDDYFYPENMGEQDSAEYEEYCNTVSNSVDITTWRKANVNLLVADVYRTVHSIKDNVEFGISPQGNIVNNERLCADVESWCTVSGYIDYICPQIYFSLDNPALTFEEAFEDWSSLDYADNVSFYAGLAGYKGGSDADSGTWQNSDTILADEYNIVTKSKVADGIMLYSYASIDNEESRGEIKNLSSALN